MGARSIFTEPFNHYVGLFTQSGLTNKWMDETMFPQKLESDLHKREHAQEKIIILTLSHLQTAFYIMFIGTALSLVVFIAELLYRQPPSRS